MTFSETIAPIVYANCVTCHRPGEAAPFPLISYDDVKKRGELVATVTRSRYMPPWHAAHGYGEFADERRLTDTQIATIGEWVKQGMPQGNPGRMPPLPQFTEGWHLGKPDLILEMPVAYTVPAGGPDIYRNFAIPTGLTEDKWVRAVEFRPSARKAVHHSLFAYVRSGAMKDFEGKDGKPGFVGLNGLGLGIGIQPNFQPSGGLGGWAVGTTPAFLSDGQAWPLAKGTDLVLQMHFHPTGKPETERSIVGLYFADQAPARRFSDIGLPTLFGLSSGIDIKPGDKDFTISRLDDAARGRPRLFRDGARALPGQGDEGHGDAARRLGAAACSGFRTGTSTGRTATPTSSRCCCQRARGSTSASATTIRRRTRGIRAVRRGGFMWGEQSLDEMGGDPVRSGHGAPRGRSRVGRGHQAGTRAAIAKGLQNGTVRRVLDHQRRAAGPPPRLQQITLLDREGKTVARSASLACTARRRCRLTARGSR